MKHNGSSIQKEATKIGSSLRDFWSDFLEPTNDGRRLGHEREVNWLKSASRDNTLERTEI